MGGQSRGGRRASRLLRLGGGGVLTQSLSAYEYCSDDCLSIEIISFLSAVSLAVKYGGV